jgi:hypothetical protein
VLMFRSKRKTNIEYIPIGAVKDWRDAEHEIEHIGTRLDQARTALARANTKWAKNYWATITDRLFKKWSLCVQLKDTGLRQQGPASIYSKIDYSWWEKSEEIPVGIPLFDNISRMLMDAAGNTDLTRSWENAREEKLQKARLGLA